MAEELARRYGEGLAAITLEPSHGGIFEVALDGGLVFEKAKEGRFPEPDEVGERIAARVG